MTFLQLWPTILCGLFCVITLLSHRRTNRLIREDAKKWDGRMAREINAMTADLAAVTASASTPSRPEKQLANGRVYRTPVAS